VVDGDGHDHDDDHDDDGGRLDPAVAEEIVC
jgi:hypothetical protein